MNREQWIVHMAIENREYGIEDREKREEKKEKTENIEIRE